MEIYILHINSITQDMRKTLFSVLAFIMVAQYVNAQNCEQLVNSNNGKKFIYASLDRKGKVEIKVAYTSIKKDGSTMTVRCELLDKNGQTSAVDTSEISCTGDSIRVGMKAYILPNSISEFKRMQRRADSKYLSYPLNPVCCLPLGATITGISDKDGGHPNNIYIAIENRYIGKEETINAPAGDFKCFRITFDETVIAKMIGLSTSVKMHVTEWYSPKFGRLIKSVYYSDKDKLMGSIELESVN